MPDPVGRLMRAVETASRDALPDRELLVRVSTGGDDGAAFELLVRRHADLVWSTCRRVAGDHHAAEDAFQAAFLALLTRARSIRGCLAGWLYRVAYHAALKTRAARLRFQPIQTLEDRPAPDPLSTLAQEEAGPIVHDELNALPAKYRDPLILCHLQGLSQAEAASRLGLPVGTLATRARRGGQRLRDRLARRGLAPAAGGIGVLIGMPVPASAELVGLVTRFGALPIPDWPRPVVHLMNGAISAMPSVKSKVLAICLLGVMVAGGLTVATGQTRTGQPASGQADSGPKGLTSPAALVDQGPRPVGGAAGKEPPGSKVEPVVRDTREKFSMTPDDRISTAVQRIHSVNHLKQILLATHSYHDTYNQWPTGIKDEQGQLLVSWRVQLLPFLEQNLLHKKFRLDQPWDSPANKPLLAEMPEVFTVGIEPNGSTDTYYQAFTGVGTICDNSQIIRIESITDGTSKTLAVAEIGPPVPWTKPTDVPYSARKPLPQLKPPFKNAWIAGMADGSVHTLRTSIDPLSLRRLVERADGEPLDLDKLRAHLMPETVEDRKEAESIAKEIRALQTERMQLMKARDELLAKLDAAKQRNAEFMALEQERQQLLGDVRRLRDEVERLKQLLKEIESTPKR